MRKWYQSIDGDPGFTKESLAAIKLSTFGSFGRYRANKNILSTSSHGSPVVFLFDTIYHMIKLIRNTLASKKIMFDSENKRIDWHYIESLH